MMTLDAASLRDAGRVDAMQRAIGLFGTVAKKVFNERGRRRSSVAARAMMMMKMKILMTKTTTIPRR